MIKIEKTVSFMEALECILYGKEPLTKEEKARRKAFDNPLPRRGQLLKEKRVLEAKSELLQALEDQKVKYRLLRKKTFSSQKLKAFLDEKRAPLPGKGHHKEIHYHTKEKTGFLNLFKNRWKGFGNELSPLRYEKTINLHRSYFVDVETGEFLLKTKGKNFLQTFQDETTFLLLLKTLGALIVIWSLCQAKGEILETFIWGMTGIYLPITLLAIFPIFYFSYSLYEIRIDKESLQSFFPEEESYIHREKMSQNEKLLFRIRTAIREEFGYIPQKVTDNFSDLFANTPEVRDMAILKHIPEKNRELMLWANNWIEDKRKPQKIPLREDIIDHIKAHNKKKGSRDLTKEAGIGIAALYEMP